MNQSVYHQALSIIGAWILCTNQIFAQSIDPISLHFEKVNQVRNFYNSSVDLSKLDLSKSAPDESTYTQLHATIPGCVIEVADQELHFRNDTEHMQESYVSLGNLYNYAAIDLGIRRQIQSGGPARAILSLHQDESNQFTLTQQILEDGQRVITMEIQKDGKREFLDTLLADYQLPPNTLRVHLTGKFINVLNVKHDDWEVLLSLDVSRYFELRDKTLLDSFSILAGAKLGKGESLSFSTLSHYLTCGTAQADPKVLHYEDGSPIIEGNHIWVAMTTRGYGTQLYQGIYRYNLESSAWNVSGTLVFNKGDGLIRQWSASDVFFDRRDSSWKVFTVSHRDDHMLYAGETTEDPRFGQVEIACEKVQYASVGNEEDPSVIWDAAAGAWRMALCKNYGKGYQTILMEANEWNGEWKQIEAYTPTSSTGILIQTIGGKRYVFIGRGKSPCPLEVLSYPAMEKIGELNLDVHPEGKNVWPAIIPVPSEKGTAYYLLTFDRDAWTGPRTYGNIHWYKAKEFAENFWEYEKRN